MIDTHCHLDSPRFSGDLPGVIGRARQAGIRHFVLPATTPDSWHAAQQIRARWPELISATAGLHPMFPDVLNDGALQQLEQFVRLHRGNIIALGETGLDRRQPDSLARQSVCFEFHLELARRYNLPLIVHSVRAHSDVLAFLKRYPDVRMVIHGFSGSAEQAKQLVSKGCYLGCGGVICQPGAHRTREAFASIPLESVLPETDAPDMLPHGIADAQRRNEPAYLPRIIARLAEIRKLPVSESEHILVAAAEQFFRTPF